MLKTIGVGRLVADPELVKTKTNQVCKLRMVFNEHKKINGESKQFSHFFDFVIWDKAAEVIANVATKGSQMWVEASPRQDTWENENGEKRSRVIFRIDNFSFVGAKPKQEDKDNTPDEDVPY